MIIEINLTRKGTKTKLLLLQAVNMISFGFDLLFKEQAKLTIKVPDSLVSYQKESDNLTLKVQG